MVTFLAGGTGTPKLLAGADPVFDPSETTVIANTGDDVEIGGHLVCPDVDTVLFLRGEVLDREKWWGINEDTTETHSRLHELARTVGLDTGPRYLDPAAQTAGRRISRWRRFSGVGEFMLIGDRDRAVHITRTGLIDEGMLLSQATRVLARSYDLSIDLLPMSDDPVATLVHTQEGMMHFQEWWVHRGGDPAPESVEFRGIEQADTTPAVDDALNQPIVIGPSNPITSIGPMLGLGDGNFEECLHDTPVVAVSPFIEDRVFSGPAADLMEAEGYDPATAGVAEAYPFVDAFVLDNEDGTTLARPVVRTDTQINGEEDAERIARACATALAEVS